ncbi:MAG TPA: SAM-dependent methyltransferase [Acidimicrobiales bacterium]|nr:SAM-dependent methyltransferase [Acidimicrobiales bacterium]
MGARPPGPSGDDDPFAIDTDIASPARVLNYLAGGEVNFATDREVAEEVGDALPGGIATARAAVRTLSAFMGRAVRYLAGEQGIAQFANIGAGIPTAKKIHEVAQQAAPGSRFVYVGDDPVVLAHAHTMRTSDGDGGAVSTYVDGNLRNPETIIRNAGETLDFDRPVAVLLLTTLNFVPDEDDPYRLVTELLEPLQSGSCLAIAHSSFDLGDEAMHEAAERLDKALRQPYVVRSRSEIAKFFDGLAMAEPGLVQIDRWRPDGRPSPAPAGRPTPVYVGVGCKP